MNAKERVNRYVKKMNCYKQSEYTKIDPWIKPLIRWMNERGYVTLHSCSAHEDEGEIMRHHWYVMFVATVPIAPLRRLVNQCNRECGFQLQLSKRKSEELTRCWIIETFMKERTASYIEFANCMIYNTFRRGEIK